MQIFHTDFHLSLPSSLPFSQYIYLYLSYLFVISFLQVCALISGYLPSWNEKISLVFAVAEGAYTVYIKCNFHDNRPQVPHVLSGNLLGEGVLLIAP